MTEGWIFRTVLYVIVS